MKTSTTAVNKNNNSNSSFLNVFEKLPYPSYTVVFVLNKYDN